MGSCSGELVLLITRRSLGSMLSMSGLEKKTGLGEVHSNQTNYNFLRSSLSKIEVDVSSDPD